MAISTLAASTAFLLFLLHLGRGNSQNLQKYSDADQLEVALNLEYLETEFFLWGALGYGLDNIAPNLALGGPPPVGAQIAYLSPLVRDIVTQFGYQEVGHLRAIKSMIQGFPRPLLNLSAASFATIMNNAFGEPLKPEFDPYANDINYLLASYYVIPYVGLTAYVGTAPNLQSPIFKKLVAGLLGVESGQDAVIRTLLYQLASFRVWPYPYTVAEFTTKISALRDTLGHEGLKDEGIIVNTTQGAEGKVSGNVLAGNEQSLSYDRTPQGVLRIVYGSGKENLYGGFYPNGADGKIARSFR